LAGAPAGSSADVFSPSINSGFAVPAAYHGQNGVKRMSRPAVHAPVESARTALLATPLPFEQTANRLVIKGLPEQCPDPIADVALLELKFKAIPKQVLGAGCVVIKQMQKKK